MPLWAEYTIAIGAALGALGVRWLLNPILGETVPFLTSFAALLLLVLLVRPGPFVAAVVIAWSGTLVLFIRPHLPLDTTKAADLWQITLFGFAGGAAGVAGWLSRRADALREEAQSELLRRGEELRLVTDAVPALISYVDHDLRYRFANAGYRNWFGRPSEEIVGEEVRNVLGDATFERVRPHLEGALAGRRGRFQGVLVDRTGTARHIVAEYVPDIRPDGAVAGVYTLVTDVSVQREAEEAEARLAALVEASADAILSISPDGEILTWNTGAERMYGYSAPEAIGRRIELVIPSDRREEERTILDRVREGESFGPYDTVRITKDGRRVHVSVTISPIRDAAGEVVGGAKIDRDITERRQVEAALKEADRKKDQFLATLAHELRNPLAAIRSAGDLLAHDPGSDPARIDRVQAVVHRHVTVMVRLIDDLLDIGRINHGKLELSKERVELSGLVDQALDASREWLERKRHHVTFERPEAPVSVDGDAVRLVQVLTNVLENACKYTEPGGHIEVRIGREGADAILTVRDDGIGIPEGKLEAIFELYARLDVPGKDEGGLGIGLTLSRQIVELHEGRMTAASEGVGRGTTITIRVPAASEDARSASAGASVPATEEPRASRRILIVDDNEDAADTMAMLLSARGHDTQTAYDGSSALEATAAFRPDVVLLDLGLPDADGVDVCKAMRAEPWGKDVVVVALTGWGQEEDRRRTAEAGFDVHLTKPADIGDVLAAIRSASA